MSPLGLEGNAAMRIPILLIFMEPKTRAGNTEAPIPIGTVGVPGSMFPTTGCCWAGQKKPRLP
jgi:hypothetical protein